MKVLIIEDEFAAANRLQKMLLKIDPLIEILAVIENVEDAIVWLSNNEAPDLMFLDIQLSDGLSFEIFESIECDCPIIFVTAYDEYAVQAFKVNSIDYLLKPINFNELQASLDKYHKRIASHSKITKALINSLIKHLQVEKPEYKTRFLVKTAQVWETILTDEINFFFIKHQVVTIVTKDAKKITIDYRLDEVENQLNPALFFRINRQMIISISSIQKINSYFNSRLKLQLKPTFENDVIVSREKVSDFKKWLDQ